MANKYALITGGSRGIGKAIALELASELGYNILLNYASNDEAAKQTQLLIQEKKVRCELLKFDVSKADETRGSLNEWEQKNPDAIIEVIVNNAGITKDGLFLWMKQEDWNSVINIAVNGFFNVTQPLLKNMLRKRYGRIINIVSLSGLKGNPGQVNYSAAKGALISATKALAQEIGKRNITVNAVAPGFIHSDMTSGFDENELKKHIPLNRFGEAQEVAQLVAFLASKKASYITGEIVNINGGLYS